MIWFRNVDRRYPFLWETSDQPPARWHGEGEGPVQYLASTPDGAWAEFLRREEIADADDLDGVERSLWAIEADDASERVAEPDLAAGVLTGGLASYAACRVEARRLRATGASALSAPSPALLPGAARGQRAAGGLAAAPERDGEMLVLFGPRPSVTGWLCVEAGRPPERLLPLVRHLG